MSTDNFPQWLEMEKDVTGLFSIFGFHTEHISLAGRQIDLVATRTDAFTVVPERWYVEVTCERVGATKGALDSQKLLLAKKTDPEARLMIVSTAGFTDDQAATLQALGIVTRTYDQLENQFIPLHRYASTILTEREVAPASDIGFDKTSYVEPDVLASRAEFTRPIALTATAWVREISGAKTGVIGALLGNLGTGKTTILQHAQVSLLNDYLAAPSVSPLPILIPLARYKHHSGRVDSLLQETLTAYGLTTYPIALVKHLAQTGRLIFLFDGLDEIHPITSIDDVLASVTNILDYLGRNIRAIISSRTHLFASTTEELAVFGPYERGAIGRISPEGTFYAA